MVLQMVWTDRALSGWSTEISPLLPSTNSSKEIRTELSYEQLKAWSAL